MVEVKKAQGTYLLSEFDGIVIAGIFLGEWLKHFFPRTGVTAGTEEDEAGGSIMEEDNEEVVGNNGKVDEMEK